LYGIKRLANLRHLNASNNRLRELEDHVTSVPLLEHLDVSFNRISEIPDTFGLLRDLRFLSLSHNRITAIPNDRLDVLGSVQVPYVLHVSQKLIFTFRTVFQKTCASATSQKT